MGSGCVGAGSCPDAERLPANTTASNSIASPHTFPMPGMILRITNIVFLVRPSYSTWSPFISLAFPHAKIQHAASFWPVSGHYDARARNINNWKY